MIETVEALVQEVSVQEALVVEPKTLDEILPVAKQLSAHDKLVLIRILADELANEKTDPTPDPLLELLPANTVIEMYSPVEVIGNSEHFIALLHSIEQDET